MFFFSQAIIILSDKGNITFTSFPIVFLYKHIARQVEFQVFNFSACAPAGPRCMGVKEEDNGYVQNDLSGMQSNRDYVISSVSGSRTLSVMRTSYLGLV